MKRSGLLLAGLALGGCMHPSYRPELASAALRERARASELRPQHLPPSAGSLWSASSVAPGSDFKARRVNDIVVIQVVETTRATSSSDTKASREAAVSAGIPRLLGLEKTLGPIKDMLGAESQSDFSGQGATARSSTLVTTIAARVSEVLASGNLVVEAERALTINGETQRVTLVGIVRPIDIGAEGSVLSSQVADLQLIVDGKGVVSDTDRPGLLYRLAQALLPF